jgi:hypothetical protein
VLVGLIVVVLLAIAGSIVRVRIIVWTWMAGVVTRITIASADGDPWLIVRLIGVEGIIITIVLSFLRGGGVTLELVM